MIRVLIADDTLIAREGWKKIFEETVDDMKVVDEAILIEDIPRKWSNSKPDILLNVSQVV